MKRTTGWHLARRPRRAALIAGMLGIAALTGACTEAFDSGANCTLAAPLCPGQDLDVRDTIIDPVLAFDSTYDGFPSRGAENFIPLIAYGDDLETVAILRFDTLLTIFIPPGDTVQSVLYVDSVFVRLRVDLTRSQVPDSVRIDLYDVNDPTADDTASAPVLARFVPQNLIGGRTFAKANLVDQILVPVSDSVMLAALSDSSSGWPRLRVGVRVSGPGPVSFRIGTTETSASAKLLYRPKDDPAVQQIEVDLGSGGPQGREDLRLDFLDYSLVLKNNLPAPANTIVLGGVPGRRAYMRFNLPRYLTDSSTIIRATLRLNQAPFPFGSALDTVVVHPRIVLASPNVVDNRRASTIIGDQGLVIADSLTLLPGESGTRELEMYTLIRAWGLQGVGANVPPRAIVLTVSNEGSLPRHAAFWSSTAPSGLRPSMRITFTRKIGFGVP